MLCKHYFLVTYRNIRPYAQENVIDEVTLLLQVWLYKCVCSVEAQCLYSEERLHLEHKPHRLLGSGDSSVVAFSCSIQLLFLDNFRHLGGRQLGNVKGSHRSSCLALIDVVFFFKLITSLTFWLGYTSSLGRFLHLCEYRTTDCPYDNLTSASKFYTCLLLCIVQSCMIVG